MEQANNIKKSHFETPWEWNHPLGMESPFETHWEWN